MCSVPQSCPTLCEPMDYGLPGFSVPGESASKNTEVGCLDLLQGIFPTQGLNTSLLPLHWQTGSLTIAPREKPNSHPSGYEMVSCDLICISLTTGDVEDTYSLNFIAIFKCNSPTLLLAGNYSCLKIMSK